MDINFLFSRVLLAAESDFATDHPVLNWLCNVISSISGSFGTVAQSLYQANISADGSDIANAMEAVGTGLMTFFMVLEIVTFCFNVDFHAGFESGLKIAVKTTLLYIIMENCMSAADAVVGVFKSSSEIDFTEEFKKIGEAMKMTAAAADIPSGIEGFVTGLVYGLALVVVIVILIVVLTMLIISMIGLVAETALLTAISPIACATLVNSQLRQTGIGFLKNLAAVSMQWGVLALCFTLFEKISPFIATLDFATGAPTFVGSVVSMLAPIISLVALQAMISKSGDITKRALGV